MGQLWNAALAPLCIGRVSVYMLCHWRVVERVDSIQLNSGQVGLNSAVGGIQRKGIHPLPIGFLCLQVLDHPSRSPQAGLAHFSRNYYVTLKSGRWWSSMDDQSSRGCVDGIIRYCWRPSFYLRFHPVFNIIISSQFFSRHTWYFFTAPQYEHEGIIPTIKSKQMQQVSHGGRHPFPQTSSLPNMTGHQHHDPILFRRIVSSSTPRNGNQVMGNHSAACQEATSGTVNEN